MEEFKYLLKETFSDFAGMAFIGGVIALGIIGICATWSIMAPSDDDANHTIKNVTVTNVKTDKTTRYHDVQLSKNTLTGNYSIETKSGKTIEIPGSSYKIEY